MTKELQDYLFDLRGYVVIENAINAAHVADINAALDGFLDLEYGQWRGNVHRNDDNRAGGLELQNIVEGGEPFERLIDHPAWIDRMRHWCGEEESYVAGLFIDECFASIRRSGGYFPVHSGGWRGAMRGQYRYKDGVFRCGQVNALVALTDIGPGDGGTMVIPGSHKSFFQHPETIGADYMNRMDTLTGVEEVHLNKGDALLFVDGIAHGASSRTTPGERRAVIYRYGVSWGQTRRGYRYSDELLTRLTPERRRILQPVVPCVPLRLAQAPWTSDTM